MLKNINFTIFIILFTTVFLHGQKLSKIEYENLKGNPKEMYYEIKYPESTHLNRHYYFSFNKNGALEKRGKWKVDNLSKNKIITFFKSSEPIKVKESKSFDDKGNLTGKIIYVAKGPFKGLVDKQKVFFYNSENSLKKIITYEASIDTLDLGYDQLNAGIKISNEYIDYDFQLESYEFYNLKGQLVKTIIFPWINKCYVYKYNLNNDILEKRIYSIHSTCDNYHSDCNSSIENCNEHRLHRFDNYRITEDVWFDKINYEYKYDFNGNWVEKKSYNYDYVDNPLIKKVIRDIKYW